MRYSGYGIQLVILVMLKGIVGGEGVNLAWLKNFYGFVIAISKRSDGYKFEVLHSLLFFSIVKVCIHLNTGFVY